MPNSTWTDRSGTLAAGAVAQNASAGTSSRSGFMIQNTHPTEEMWFNVGVVAVQASPSIRIAALSLYETPRNASPQGFVSVIATTIAHPWTMKEWSS